MERLLASWVLILVVILLRRLLRGRITPGLQYALWLLVAARLLIPGSLFPAPVSVAGAAADLREVLLDRAEDHGSPAVLRPLPDLYGASAGAAGALPPPGGDGPSFGQRTQDVPEAAAKETPTGGESSGIAPARLAVRIWLAGAVLMAAALGMSNLLFALRLYRLRRPLNLPAGAGQGRLRVYAVEELASPCLFGLLRPAVYLNGAALKAACPGHVLAHEYTHYRHGDHIWALVRALCLAVYWFDPMVWLAASLSRRDCELACDAGTIRRLGEAQRLDYGRTLLALVPPGRSPADLLHTATTMTAGGRAMARRIALIARRPRMLKVTLAAVVLVMCAAVVVTFGGRALGEAAAPEVPADFSGAMPGGEQLNRRQGVYTFLMAGLDPSGRADSIAVALYDVRAQELNLLSLPRDVYIDVDWESKRLSAACAQPGGIQELRVQVSRLLGFLPDYCLAVDLNAAAALVDAIGGVMYDVPQGMDYEDPFQNLSIHLEPGLQTLSGAQALGMLRYRYYKNGDLDRIALQQQFLKAALSRCLEDPPLLESLAVLAAGGVETDLTAEELLWFARQAASLTPDSLRAYTLPVLSMDLVEGQSYCFADPEGTAALLDRFFNPYTQPVDAQDLHIVYMRSGRLCASDEEGALREALARLEALSGGDGIGYHARGVFGAPATAQLSTDRLPALREAFASCAWTPADAPEVEPGSWHSTTVGPFTFYDSTPLVRWADGETEDWYTVPGGWLAAEAALADWPEELTAEERRFLLLYREARSAWEMMTGGYMSLRYDSTLETEAGTMCAVGFFAGIDDLRGYLQTLFTPETAEYLLSCRELREQDGRLYALPADRPSNVYAGEETVRAFPISEEEALYYDEEAVIVAWTQVLGEDLETVLGQKRRDYACVWNGTNYIFTSFSPWDDVNPQAYVNAQALWDSLQAGEEWLPLLAYMDWGALAGVDAGEYDAALEVLDALGHYINENGPELTAAEYLYILSAAEGLDGAYSEGYGYMVYQLYTLNPSQFAYVVLEQLPEEQRSRALDCIRSQWSFHREPYTDAVPGREEALARLEADLAAGVSAGPSAMTLEQAGASFQFLPVNAYGIYAAAYESSDPGVAAVDESGTVTALSPGRAVITLRYEGPGGSRDFTCAVTCAWN